jgi:cell wall assembly regulator SMI1
VNIEAPAMPVQMQQILDSMEYSGLMCKGQLPPASLEDIAQTERELGVRLPDSFRALYSVYNGGTFGSFNRYLEPLLPAKEGELSVATSSRLLRSWDWSIPDELVMFGGDGTDEGNFRTLVRASENERAAGRRTA